VPPPSSLLSYCCVASLLPVYRTLPMQEPAKPFSRHSNYLLWCYAQRLYCQNSVDSKRTLSAAWPSATPQSITQILLPPPDFKSLHQTGRVCLLPGGLELPGPATPRESLVKPNQGQLQVYYQGSGIGHDLDLDVCWSRIFNSMPVPPNALGSMLIRTVTVSSAYLSVLPESF
jgi:hypothetical protein